MYISLLPFSIHLARLALLLTLAVGLCGVVTLVDDEVCGIVVVAAREVGVDDGLGTVGISDLGIQRSTGHVRNHGVTATPVVLGGSQRVVFRGGLVVPDITTVAGEVTRLEGGSDVLLDNDGATGGVDEVRALLHLGDEVLVEHTLGLLMERAVDGNNVTLGQHLLEGVDAAASNLLLLLLRQGLVVEVEKLLAVEGLEAAEDTLTNAADSDGTDNLALKIELLLGSVGDIPLATLDLLVGRDEVADENEDASDLSDGDTAVGLVGSVEVDVVRADTSGNSELEVLGTGQTLSGQVTRVERSGDDDLSILELLVELGTLAVLVGGCDKSVTLVLEPLADAELVLSCAEKEGLL
ncbi:hypothetical protein HG530_008923 [Fusarium avenaceum]|nr:hypothetical protein HG530_008923 [Fusarium avenaceum]